MDLAVPIWRGEALIDYVAGVARSYGFEKDDSGLFIRARPVFHPARRHTVLDGTETDDAVAKLHSYFATPNQEHFVCIVVLVPRELAFELNELHLLSI
jgi:hypothetical protein